jgi:hypothetical protein
VKVPLLARTVEPETARMSIARHHNEWLSLLDVSGPFLSIPVLLRALPQGLEAHDPEVARTLRAAFDEWEEAVPQARAPSPAIHTAWLNHVFSEVLGYPATHWLTGSALPPGLEAVLPDHGETLRATHALKAPGDTLPQLLVQTWPAPQKLDKPVSGARWHVASPHTRLMTLLHATGVPLGLATNGAQWSLVAARPGQATTFVTWHANLWAEEPLTLRALQTLLSARRFFGSEPGNDLVSLIQASLADQQEVTDQLGLQVRSAVEVLVRSLDRINAGMDGRLLREVTPGQLYEAALAVMMRLVFLLCAEERRLLPADDAFYASYYAIGTLRDQLREAADRGSEQVLESRHDAWARVLATFRLVHGGCDHGTLRLPAYGGSLFDPDRHAFLEGRPVGTCWKQVAAQPLPVSNRTVLHLLEALQFLQMRVPGGSTEARRLSFRALDIEQIGHVYEGLLDHTARRDEEPVLGIEGAKGKDFEVALTKLEAKRDEGIPALVEFLREKTGRGAAALRRAIESPPRPGPEQQRALHRACGTDTALLTRVQPWAALLRADSEGLPVVVHPGSVYVTRGGDRRSTGTHYTPRTLTERVVATTLAPLAYAGVDRGEEPTVERLRSPEQLLALKLCDPACGSGAFLVQACRYLADRLVEGWALADERRPAGSPPLTIPEATRAEGHPAEQVMPTGTEERLALARRLVAERCLYGVDVNPMAVEMAKLSLWLITLHKDRPFTFLDHAIKCGDSLLGLHDPAQIECFHLAPERAMEHIQFVDTVASECRALLSRARQQREALEAFTVIDLRDAEQKAALHADAEAAIARVKSLGDLVIGAALSTAGSDAPSSLAQLDSRMVDLARRVEHAWLEPLARAAEPNTTALRQQAAALLSNHGRREARRPFHWLAEFPEVFLHRDDGHGGGFDAIVGNPPFVGGQKITGLLGTDYRDHLVVHLAEGRRGSADLCAYFFLRGVALVRPGGYVGLLAVNTIAEGDTRQVGIEAMRTQGITIHAAWPNFEWPGAAAVVASQVHLHRPAANDERWQGAFTLSGSRVPTISAFLSAEEEWSPKPLRANAGKSFQGSIVLGLGFTMSEAEAQTLIAHDAKNAEALFPYLNGEDLNSHPEQKASRWVINFWDWPLGRDAEGSWQRADKRQRERWLREGRVPADYPARVAADFPELLAIVRKKVKPERDRNNRKERREKWWHFAEKCPALYHAIGRGRAFARHPGEWAGIEHDAEGMPSVLACTRVSKFLNFAWVPNDSIFTLDLFVFALPEPGAAGLLQSCVHEVWVMKHKSTQETRLRYTATDCFETFPFPTVVTNTVSQAAERYFAFRRATCRSRGLGLTELYNKLHEEEASDLALTQLRTLRQVLDRAVRDAYGWTDLDLGHGFHTVPYLPENDRIRFTISEPARLEVLRRLSRLNRERWQAEQDPTAISLLAGERSATPPPHLTLVSSPHQSDMFND